MDDPRCCGTGTCIINAEGYCWCGQRWDGERMCFPGEARQAAALDSATDVAARVGSHGPDDANASHA